MNIDFRCMIADIKSPKDFQTFRITPNATNRLAIIFDPITDDISFTVCVEIFDIGGKTPPNRHQFAAEMFFILKGEGKVDCDGRTALIKAGDSILVPATGMHVIENIGKERLYALCVMVPNEDFAELIRRGTPVELDEEDLAVLSKANTPVLI